MAYGARDYYSHGAWNVTCDQCGSKRKSHEIRERWDHALVCRECWEERQPQDFIQAVAEDQSVPFSRPTFLIFGEDHPTLDATITTVVVPSEEGQAGSTVKLVLVNPNSLIATL